MEENFQDQNYLMFSDWMKLLTQNGTWKEIWVVLRQESICFYQQQNKDLKWIGSIKLISLKYDTTTDKGSYTFKLFYSSKDAIWSKESEISNWLLEPLLFLVPSELAYKCWIKALSIVAKKSDKSETKMKTSFENEITDTVLVEKLQIENPKIIETLYVERLFQPSNDEESLDMSKMIWSLLSKFREGTPFSLPINLLEPKSSLDKFADNFLHIDILSEAAIEKDPLMRMKLVVKWYLSGFYLQSKSLKKPYIPVLGETFRCFWYHPKTNSKTFFLAEQISDKPQEVAIYIINQKDGFSLSGNFIVNLSFSGNTVTVKVEDKDYHVILSSFQEKYSLAIPYVQISGILTGNVVVELGGEINISCDKTVYNTILNFKLKTLFGNSEYDEIQGTINSDLSVIAMIKGHWNAAILLEDNQTHEKQCFWNPTPDIHAKRLKQFIVPIEEQMEFESEKLWLPLTEAILKNDQTAADKHHATIIKKDLNPEKKPKFFFHNEKSKTWLYKYKNVHEWNSKKHNYQYENNFIIQSGYCPEGNAICLKMKLPSEEKIITKKSNCFEDPMKELIKHMEDLHEKYNNVITSLQSDLELIIYQYKKFQKKKQRSFLLGILGGLLIVKLALSQI